MTTAFQASIRYPLIWIINLHSPDDFRVKRNENYTQFPRLASMRSYLLAHYLCSYQYELKQALLNGETELEISHLLGVHVENIRFLNFHFYKKSFSEVYVDAFFRADMTAYTGNEDNPQCRSVYSDYLIRGYCDFKSSRVRLVQGIMPVSKAYPLPYTELDDFLLPKYSDLDIEEAAQEILFENYPYSIYRRINSNILAKSLELSIYKTGLGENEPDGGRFYCRDTETTLYTSEHEAFHTTVSAKTILIERSLKKRDELKAVFSKYITERGWSNKSLADTSYFTEDRIKEIRNGNGRKVDAEEIILFGIIVNLTYTQMKEMMRIGGIGLTSSKRHLILDKILSRYEGATLEFYNGLMKRMDQAPINEA